MLLWPCKAHLDIIVLPLLDSQQYRDDRKPSPRPSSKFKALCVCSRLFLSFVHNSFLVVDIHPDALIILCVCVQVV